MSKHLLHHRPRALGLSLQCERLALPIIRHTIAATTTTSNAPPTRRSFTTTFPRPAGTMGRAYRPTQSSNSAQPSLKTEQAKQMAAAQRTGKGLNEDFGLLEGTVVFPTGANRPSPLHVGTWLRMLRAVAWVRTKELGAAFWYRFVGVRPRPRKLEWFSVAKVAARLHSEMYTAFAEGRVDDVRDRLCPGITKRLKDRVVERPAGVGLRWRVERLLESPRTVSFRAILSPGPKGTKKDEMLGLKQAVVRIRSLQSLQHVRRVVGRGKSGERVVTEVLVDAAGRALSEVEMKASPVVKESVEYLVVQKLLVNSEEKEWKVWGTTRESLPDEFAKKVPREKLEIDRLR